MRRPLLIMYIILLSISFIYTKNKTIDDKFSENEIVIVKGVVKDKIEKERYDQYKIGNFLVNDYSKNKDLDIGKVVKVNGKYKSLDNMKFENFDYGRYIRSIGYEGLIYIDKYEIINNSNIYLFIGNIKEYIKDTFRYLYKEKSDFINSIILGKKEYLSEEEKEIFTRTGTSHIIAISGLHTGLLCGMIAFIMGGINRYYKLVILSMLMILYSLMVGSSPSIVRSIFFMIVLYLSVFLERKRDGISTLSLIGIFFIINNPYIIYNISFQLSFLATLSIIYFYGYINEIFKISLVSLTISANILTIPLVYYNFKGVPLLTIVSNMIIVPFMGVIIYLSVASIIIFRINLWVAKLIACFNKYII
ncbi:MAG: ComEC/Rec2 family competence protein, partial [Peptostreptococcaceae bacterium]|nr:ComEC/Rec2 family competence protein [Peptostreptococcaceae bacterium]